MITFIVAGGGLVQNGFGEYLLIFRNGKWDLPKGKQECGEALHLTALREVSEECGLTSITLGPFIASTRHSYWTEDMLIFKQTHWYHIYTERRPPLHPQSEEGIEQCRWCAPEEAIQLLSESYPSIRWIFQHVTQKK